MTHSDKRVRIGVIGTGVLGRYHTKILSESQNAELAGVYDPNAAAAKRVADEFHTKTFNSLEALAAECDGVTAAVPATLHCETVMRLFKLGMHVLVEKPIAVTMDEAVKMISAANDCGLVFGVGHVERFNPVSEFAHENCKNPVFIEIHRLAKYPPPRPGLFRRGTEVSVVLDLMIHDLDLVLSLVNSDVERFEASGAPVLSETDDIATARLIFKNGAAANITASRISPTPMRRLRVFGKDACYLMDAGNHTGSVMRKTPLGITRKQVVLPEVNALAAEIEDFIECVAEAKLNGGKAVRQPRISGADAAKALDLAIKISQAISASNKKSGLLD